MRILIPFILILLCVVPAWAGECFFVGKRVVQRQQFVAVPFAIPVAVPVAVVQQPVVIYGYAPAAQTMPLTHAATEPTMNLPITNPSTMGSPITGSPVAVPAADLAASADTPTASGALVAPHGEPQDTSSTDPAKQLHLAAEALLLHRCAVCHSANKAAGSVVLFSDTATLLPALARQRVLEAVQPNDQGRAHMPPAGHTPLSEAEVEVIRQWAKPPKELIY